MFDFLLVFSQKREKQEDEKTQKFSTEKVSQDLTRLWLTFDQKRENKRMSFSEILDRKSKSRFDQTPSIIFGKKRNSKFS